MAEANKRYAAVTGANKGIGFEICKQLASNGIMVILTARDEKRGLEAVDKLKQCGFSDHILFHQLDVTDTASVASFTHFIQTRFGKLDILETEYEMAGKRLTQTYELAEECLKLNYYGTNRMIKALLPLLQLSDAPKVVNVSATMGKLQYVQNEWAKEVLGDADNLTEERVDEILNEYLKDFKEGCIETKNWPAFLSAYILSKAAVNAYTRILAKKYPTLCINCVCPGYVKTDLNCNTGPLSVEEGAESPVRLALLPKGAPSGCFFLQKEKSPF